MKKIILIVLLFVINISIFKLSEKTVSLEKIDFNLEYNELGIVFLNLETSDSLLLSLNDINILYLINYQNSLQLKEEITKMKLDIDFIVMNENYDIPFNVPKKIVNDSLNLNNITFNNDNYKSINYNNQSLCINNTNCDYTYFTKPEIKVNDNQLLFFNSDLKLPDNLYKEWVDIYKINPNVYTVLKINNTYKVIEIIKNI